MKMFAFGPTNPRSRQRPPQLSLRTRHFRLDRLRHGNGDEKPKPLWRKSVSHGVYRKAPNSELQAPEKPQTSSSKEPSVNRRALAAWYLELEILLGLGIWNF